jgi:protein-tyrosine-phosphatase
MNIYRNPSIVSFLACLQFFYFETRAEENFVNSTTKTDEPTTNTIPKADKHVVKSVLMVCSTNQCRSPIVAAVFKELAQKKGVSEEWSCDSAGIYVYHPDARWPMDKRSRATLRNHGIMETKHSAREVTEADFNRFDYILGMDVANVEDLRKKAPAGSKAKIELLSTYDPKGSKAIRYPFYDQDAKGFEECYKIAYRACNAFIGKYTAPDP